MISGFAAKAFNEFPNLKFLQCTEDFIVRAWEEEGDGVFQQFGEDAARTDNERQAKLWIAGYSDDKFDHSAFHHFFDEEFITEF